MPEQPSKLSIWVGRILSALIVLFLAMDGISKFFQPPPVVAAFAQLGLPMSTAIPVGVLALLCLVLYAIPRTAILGAVLMTGFYGGAVAIHLRVGDPLFSHILFPVYLGALAWLGLYLRDQRVRGLL